MIICRIAPSPTGRPHIGNLYIFLFNKMLVEKYKGKLILRIDDTDKVRNDSKYVKEIISLCKDFNIPISDTVFQSRRTNIYNEYIERLEKLKILFFCNCNAKPCVCENKDENRGISNEHPILFSTSSLLNMYNNDNEIMKIDNDKIMLLDILRGYITFDKSVICNPFIIRRSDGSPTYHFASILDDYNLNITHVLRAEDWLTSLFKHVCLLIAFNILEKKPMLNFLHLPIIKSGNKKLSKREGNGGIVYELLNEGILPDALSNYLMYISLKNQPEEVFEKPIFEIEYIRKVSPMWDNKKLLWFNRQYLKKTSLLNLLSMPDINKNRLSLTNASSNELLLEIKNNSNTLNECMGKSAFICNDNAFIREKIKGIPKDDKKIVYDRIEKIAKWYSEVYESDDSYILSSLPKDDIKNFCSAIRLIVTFSSSGPNINLLVRCLTKEFWLKRLMIWRFCSITRI